MRSFRHRFGPALMVTLFLLTTLGAGSSEARRRRSKRRASARRMPAPALGVEWTAADSRRAVRALLSSLRAQPGWLDAFRRTHKRKPLLAVHSFGNRSSQHGPRASIGKALRAELRRPRLFKVLFRRGAGGRGRRARAADFVLDGFFFSTKDAKGGRALHHYVVALQLLSVRTNEKVWLGLHEQKRLLERPADERGRPKIRRVPAAEIIDLSGSFSGDDGRLLTERAHAGLAAQLRARRRFPRPPFIESLPLRNRTSLVINYRLLTLRLEALLLASKRVRLLAGHPESLAHLRRERARAPRGQSWRPRGSDAILSGELVTHGGTTRVFHLSARIVKASTAEVLYQASGRVKKLVRPAPGKASP